MCLGLWAWGLGLWFGVKGFRVEGFRVWGLGATGRGFRDEGLPKHRLPWAVGVSVGGWLGDGSSAGCKGFGFGVNPKPGFRVKGLWSGESGFGYTTLTPVFSCSGIRELAFHDPKPQTLNTTQQKIMEPKLRILNTVNPKP